MNCIEAAENVYRGLVKQKTEKGFVRFETLEAIVGDGGRGRVRRKRLVSIFRPDKEGKITHLDFIKAIDAVYRELRILSATIKNSAQIDRAYERVRMLAAECRRIILTH